MSEDRMTVFELKEKAKWSSDPEEKKAAIKELSTRGENAISELQEIMSITAYGDIRNACAEAIKSMRQARSKVEINETSSSSSTTTSYSSSNNSAANVVITKDQKKEKFEKKEEEAKSA